MFDWNIFGSLFSIFLTKILLKFFFFFILNKTEKIFWECEDKINVVHKSVIYEMKSIDCDTKSIGQIKQKPKTRLKEHQLHFKNNQKERSANAKHCIKSGHYFTK